MSTADYFVNPGTSETATVQWTLNNGDANGNQSSADFNIQGPSGNLLPVANMLPNGNGVAIGRGPTITAQGTHLLNGACCVGIDFSTVAQPPAGANASFTYIQIINNLSTTVVSSQGQVPLPINPATGLDGTYPYFNGTPTETWDSPNSSLPALYGELFHAFDATMYLLWDPGKGLAGCHTATTSNDGNYIQTPSTCTSIPIPLASVRWTWSGCAINTLQIQANGTTWTRSCGASTVYQPVTIQPGSQTGYPQWTVTVNPLGMQQ